MRSLMVIVLLLAWANVARAQQPDTTATRDSIARADSAARADSIAIVREIERMGAGNTRPDTTRPPPVGPGQGSINPRLLPDISAIGEAIGDLSPDGSTQESGRRIDIREVELALSAAVDPYFRADFILGLSDLEGISVEEAYITAVALPGQLQARIGRFHMPVGKQNTTHRAELQTIEYPHVVQRFLGPEASKGTGLWVSKILAPFGFYQEFLVTVVDHFGESEEELTTTESPTRRLSGLGFSSRFRNYWDLAESTNLELSASAATGRRAQPVLCADLPSCPAAAGAPGVNVRQSLVGADLTFRWRPLQRALYKSFILQAEYMRQLNERDPALPPEFGTSAAYAGPRENASGAYVFARYQLSRRTYLGGRYDWVEEPDNGAGMEGGSFTAASAYLQLFPSEFSKFVLGYERQMPPGRVGAIDRILLQTTFAVGPHRPHPF